MHHGTDLGFGGEVDPIDERPHEPDPSTALSVHAGQFLAEAGEVESVPLSMTEMAHWRLASSTVTS
jgi:hypothetical protein